MLQNGGFGSEPAICFHNALYQSHPPYDSMTRTVLVRVRGGINQLVISLFHILYFHLPLLFEDVVCTVQSRKCPRCAPVRGILPPNHHAANAPRVPAARLRARPSRNVCAIIFCVGSLIKDTVKTSNRARVPACHLRRPSPAGRAVTKGGCYRPNGAGGCRRRRSVCVCVRVAGCNRGGCDRPVVNKAQISRAAAVEKGRALQPWPVNVIADSESASRQEAGIERGGSHEKDGTLTQRIMFPRVMFLNVRTTAGLQHHSAINREGLWCIECYKVTTNPYTKSRRDGTATEHSKHRPAQRC